MDGKKLVKLEYKNGCWYAVQQPFKEGANVEVTFVNNEIVDVRIIDSEERKDNS